MADIIANNNPNNEWGKSVVEIVLKQWAYEATYTVRVGGNCRGFDVVEAAVDNLCEQLLGDDTAGIRSITLTNKDGETLYCEDDDDREEYWIKRMIASIRLVDYEQPTLNHIRKLNGALAGVVAELRDASDGWSGDAVCISAEAGERAASFIESQAKALSEAEQSKRGGFAFWKNIARIFSQRAKSERAHALAAEARLADKEVELSIAKQINHDLTDGITGTLQKDKIESLEARLAEAMKVIEPFAKAAIAYDPDEGEPNSIADKEAVWGDDDLEVGHLRAARA